MSGSVDGLDDLKKEFGETAEAITKELEVGMTQACILVQGQAAINAPVDTGLLRGSIVYDVENDGDKIEGIVGTAVEYAPYVEYGTTRQKAQPYLEPALSDNTNRIASIMADAVERGLR